MDDEPKAARYGSAEWERCPNCGKFADRDDCWHDLENRDELDSSILRFCTESCADRWHARKRTCASETHGQSPTAT